MWKLIRLQKSYLNAFQEAEQYFYAVMGVLPLIVSILLQSCQEWSGAPLQSTFLGSTTLAPSCVLVRSAWSVRLAALQVGFTCC